MKKIFTAGLLAGIVLLGVNVIGLFTTIWLFQDIADEYFNPAFETGSDKIFLYLLHPFIMSMALSWFWQRFKGVLTGSFLTRGIEFGLIYVLIATFPMMWLIYSAMSLSLAIVATWFVLALVQGITSGLVFEKINP